MIKKIFIRNLIIFIFINCYFTNLYAANLGTVNISYILDKSISYNSFLDELSNKEIEINIIIKSRQSEIKKRKKEIKDSELIVSENELALLISDYNNELSKLENEVNNYNTFFSNNIEINKNIIIKQIITFVEKISVDLNLDIILTEEQYFMSSKKIDISDNVINQINVNLIELEILNDQE